MANNAAAQIKATINLVVDAVNLGDQRLERAYQCSWPEAVDGLYGRRRGDG